MTCRRWLTSLTIVLWTLLHVACGDAGTDPTGEAQGTTTSTPTTSVQIEFTKAGPIRLTAGDSVTLKVRVTYEDDDRPDAVRFSVLGNSGSAFLDASLVPLGPNDTASVTLTAPSEDSFFLLRASAAGASAEVEVNVAVRGFTNVAITPSYTGTRVIDEWEGSVHIGKECSSLEGSPPPAGERRTIAEPESTILIEEVPIGQSVAVVVRAAAFAGGCQTITNLIAGETFQLVVNVADRPLRLDQLSLDLEFSLNSTSEFNGALDTLVAQLVNRATADHDHDLVALLEAMQDATKSEEDAEEFAGQRERLGWDSLLTTGAMGTTPADSIRARLNSWLTAGVDSLFQRPLFQGKIVEADQAAGTAFLRLDQVAGFQPSDAGFPESPLLTTSAEPGDTLLLGTSIAWLPNVLILSLTEQVIEAQGLGDVPQALASQLSCSSVSQTLVLSASPGNPMGEAFYGCNVGCLVDLCEDALDEFWDRVSQAPVDLAQLELNSAGPATIDSQAAITDYDATWVGSASLAGLQQLPVTGRVHSLLEEDRASAE